jgi:nucleoside-specific outer membrane channel protein Tsx
MSCAGLALGATWSDSFLGYRYGEQFREPGNTREVRKQVLQYSQTSAYATGQNFVNLDVLQSDRHDPASGGDAGATEFYLTYRHQFHLGKLLDRDLSWGPVRELAFTTGFDLNSKNTGFAPRKRLLVAGPTLKFSVPNQGFLDLSLLAGQEWNHCGLASCTDKTHAFDAQWMLSAAWGLPFEAGPLPLRFQGFINYNSRKGRDYAGVDTEPETLMRTALMADVGRMAGAQARTLLVGVGYEVWLNKFGNHATASGVTKPGINTYTPTLQMEWHF